MQLINFAVPFYTVMLNKRPVHGKLWYYRLRTNRSAVQTLELSLFLPTTVVVWLEQSVVCICVYMCLYVSR